MCITINNTQFVVKVLFYKTKFLFILLMLNVNVGNILYAYKRDNQNKGNFRSDVPSAYVVKLLF